MQKELDEVVDEVRLLWNTLVYHGEQVHADTGITMSMRAVLEYLSRNGPTNVPTIARERRVTRQHIQGLVNALLDEGHVEAVENPAHKRSALIRLTKSGERLIGRMRRKEARRMQRAEVRIPRADLQRAAETLRALRRALDR